MKRTIVTILILGCLGEVLGKLPLIVKEIRNAQIQLLIESRSSSWGKPWVPD